LASISINDIFKQFDGWLTAINDFIWSSEQNIDFTSTSFYVFKAFPKHLKKVEIKQWSILQANTLSPFSNGDQYQYLSHLGLHLWVTNNTFSGIPETASQTGLHDGEHVVKGKNSVYQQNWLNGIMLDSVSVDQIADSPKEVTTNGAYDNSVKLFDEKSGCSISQNAIPLITNNGSWAVPRKLDIEIKKPDTWLAVSFFVILCGFVWGVAGYATISLQNSVAEDNIAVLTDSLGEKLQQQNQLRTNEQLISNLKEWQHEHGFLPETFAALARKLTLQGNWQVNTLIWQNKTIELEFVSIDMNITTLVGDLEQIDILQQVNIRPHNAENTWILEAQLK
jgi:hypothetical protein